ncbi:hypothetical protein GUITHDRAFT_119809 [Guillardia theta CCMP2712]|uniref:Uncharacterized protein n=1 Tax=Guillardia theta (strain CCMP2712) TaxID=905079 RepID=L1IDL9_GUITC|nr:hypothetical protein GUITHDRAFT_119809 [Guillardia theta CCMP2712]EKX34009.1 hypothetical protein GUITHDRAFT_119809 [Guillardia theta CCMP2712]|eukprot:XP_005820989.1 hypothetical protein GUITHDRAFT_119809 [Guillardia theta CCMP2712]
MSSTNGILTLCTTDTRFTWDTSSNSSMAPTSTPLCKDAFEEFFGHCPLTAPVTTTSNLMTEFHLSESSDSWIDDFESLESVIECANHKTKKIKTLVGERNKHPMCSKCCGYMFSNSFSKGILFATIQMR